MGQHKKYLGVIRASKARAIIKKVAQELTPLEISWEDDKNGSSYFLSLKIEPAELTVDGDGSVWKKINLLPDSKKDKKESKEK